MPTVNLGTSSWNFPDWKGVFYPQTIPNARMLSFYSGIFQTVEVNTSFYALPKPTTLVNWVESVPPGFTFCLKAPRAITHEKRLVDCRSETLAYIDALRSLGRAAAPGLLQLPPSLSRASDGRNLALYIEWLASELDGVSLAVEVRAADLMTTAFASFLSELGLGLVLVDRVSTPDLFPIWVELVNSGGAPNFCLIRWIGDDKEGPSGNRDLVNPRDEELEEWAKRIMLLSDAGISVYGYMHNPYEGHSPESVQRLIANLGDGLITEPWPPENWVSPLDMKDENGQLSLFDEG